MAAPSLTYTLTNATTADASQVMQNLNDLLNGITDGTKDLSISALTCAGTVTLNGNTTIGNATSDTLTMTASLASSIIPSADGAVDIGSAAYGLRALYLGDGDGTTGKVVAAALSADRIWTIPETSADASFVMTAATQTIGGAKTFSSVILGADGSKTTPTYGFSADTDTGIYRSTTNTIGFSAGDTAVCTMAAALIRTPASVVVQVQDAYSTTATDTPNLIVQSDGTLRRSSTGNVQAAAGTQAAPSISFSGDTDAGLYSYAANTIGVTCGNSVSATFAAALVRYYSGVDVQVQAAYDNTTATAANVVVQSDGTLRRSTSSLKYKEQIEDLTDDHGKLVYSLRPITFKPKNKQGRHFGLIAEEVAEVAPMLVEFGDKGQPEGVQYSRIVVLLLKALQKIDQRLSALEM
jgi:hypothetical protein